MKKEDNNIANVMAYFHGTSLIVNQSAADELGLSIQAVQDILDAAHWHQCEGCGDWKAKSKLLIDGNDLICNDCWSDEHGM